MSDTLKNNRFVAALELGLALLFILNFKPFLDQFFWKYAGPATLAVTLTIITIYLHRRGETWASLGLRSLPSWKSILLVLPQTLLAVVAIIGTGAGMAFGGDALGLWDVSATPEGVEDRWGDIEGNLTMYLVWLGLSWISAGFGEELFFRAFMISRAERIFKGIPFALFFAILIPALIFGYVHYYYQGFRGLIVTGMIGLMLGLLYLLYKRNLWPLILAHGIVDSIGFTAMYLNLDV